MLGYCGVKEQNAWLYSGSRFTCTSIYSYFGAVVSLRRTNTADTEKRQMTTANAIDRRRIACARVYMPWQCGSSRHLLNRFKIVTSELRTQNVNSFSRDLNNRSGCNVRDGQAQRLGGETTRCIVLLSTSQVRIKSY